MNFSGHKEFGMEISVVMSVYNTRPDYLSEAIESILQQSYDDFEFIIIDDGTTDKKTLETLEKYKEKDSRINIIVNKTNIGLTKSLNIGLKKACGKYIARIDSDDIAYRHRLEKQYHYMEQHQEVDILGTLIKKFGKAQNAEQSYHIDYTQNDYESFIIKMLFYNVGPIHPTVMMRKSFLVENRISYNENVRKAQDYALWMDCILAGGKILNLPEVLLKYRIHDNQITVMENSEQTIFMREVSIQNFKRLDFVMAEKEYEMLLSLYTPGFEEKPICYINALNKLRLLNQQIGRFSIKKFNSEIKIRWIHKVMKSIIRRHDFSGLCYGYTYQCFFSRAFFIWMKDYLLKKDWFEY